MRGGWSVRRPSPGEGAMMLVATMPLLAAVEEAGAAGVAGALEEPRLWRKFVPPPPPPPQAPPGLQAGAPVEWADGRGSCHIEPHTEFDGQHVVHWGDNHLKGSAGECCEACKEESAGPIGCNVWVWCASPDGCYGRKHKECWLKHQNMLNPGQVQGQRHAGVPWTSGAIYTAGQKAEYEAKVAEQAIQEAEYLDRLRTDLSRPMVWLDISIKGRYVGRVTIVLFNKESPRAAENYRQLITGERGVAPAGHEGAGKPYHLKGAAFYRIIDQFIIQTGAGTDSVFGGTFKDDPGGLKLKHEKKGLLSMANMGPDTNGSHMSIMLNPAPHLDGKYTVFGQVVDGMDVVRAVNALAKGKPDNTATAAERAVISDCGQIRPGLPFEAGSAARLQL
mmetsp:Transcript_44655/g.113025  ORF Transcript_44655/g.113025 Transcript_44655/m.113025 type:complete len:391 (-) Transcript_44655:100-1272(-)